MSNWFMVKNSLILILFFLLNKQFLCAQNQKSLYDLEKMVNDQNFPRFLIINIADSLLKCEKKTENLHLIYYFKGLAYEDMGLYSYSQKFYQESMNIALKSENDSQKIKSYLGLGNMYLHREMLSESGKCYRKLLILAEKSNEVENKIAAYSSMANYLKNVGKTDSSFYFVRKTIALVQNKKRKSQKKSCYLQINYNTLSKLFLNKNQADSALYYAQKSLDLFDQTNLFDGKISSLSTIARAHQLKGNIDLAEQIILKEIELIEEFNLEEKFIDEYDFLSRIYEQKSEIKKALIYSRLFQNKKHYIDSLGSETRLFEMNRIFENNIDKLNLVLTQEKLNAVNANIKKRNITYFSIFVISFLIIVGLIILVKKRKNELLNKSAILLLEQKRFEKEKEISELEKQFLEKKIEWKNKNIVDTAIISARKTELILVITSKLKDLLKTTNMDKISIGLSESISYLKDQLTIDKNNLGLQDKVLENNEHFYDQLKEKFPTLSKSDLELCGLIKLDLSIKEIATIRNNTFETIKTARFRIRKKLNLNNADVSTHDFLNSL